MGTTTMQEDLGQVETMDNPQNIEEVIQNAQTQQTESEFRYSPRTRRFLKAISALGLSTSIAAGGLIAYRLYDRDQKADAASAAVHEGEAEAQALDDEFNLSEALNSPTTTEEATTTSTSSTSTTVETTLPRRTPMLSDWDEGTPITVAESTTTTAESTTTTEAPTTTTEVFQRPELSREMLNMNGATGLFSIPSIGLTDRYLSLGDVQNNNVEQLERGIAIIPSSHSIDTIEDGEVVGTEVINDLSLPVINEKGLAVAAAHATSYTSEAGAAPLGRMDEIKEGDEISMAVIFTEPSGVEHIGIARYRVSQPCNDENIDQCRVKAEEFFYPFVSSLAEQLKDEPGKLMLFTCDKGVEYRKFIMADLVEISFRVDKDTYHVVYQSDQFTLAS